MIMCRVKIQKRNEKLLYNLMIKRLERRNNKGRDAIKGREAYVIYT